MKRLKRDKIVVVVLLVSVLVIGPAPVSIAETIPSQENSSVTGELEEDRRRAELETDEENPVYDQLQKRIKNEWNKGLESIEESEVIKITGNPAEHLLRVITAALFRNINSIKAGALLIGMCSFSIGIIIAVSARKNKKARRFAVVALVTVIPATLFILTFCLAVLVSIFK